MRHATDYGLAADNVRFDAQRVILRSRDIAARLRDSVVSRIWVAMIHSSYCEMADSMCGALCRPN
jgi:hypothetical protein